MTGFYPPTIDQYITNSAQTTYTFAFYAPLNTDITVYYQSSTATPIPSIDVLTLNVGYTVTYNSDPTTGGTITLLFTPTTGYYLTIVRTVQDTLVTSFANAQTFNGANLDAALNRLLLLIQQNTDIINNRNLSYIINTYLPNAQPFTQLPPLAQNQYWVGSGAGIIAATVVQNPNVSILQSQLANNSPGTDGARMIGYYDAVTPQATTVQAFLANILTFIQNNIQINAFKPGDMKAFGGTSLPSGWLLCDGSAVSRGTYANLFSAIGTNWGSGDGSTTFNLPDMRRRVPMGSGGSGTATIGNAVGNIGGEENHTLIVNEMPSHSHTLLGDINTSDSISVSTSGHNVAHQAPNGTIGSTGGSAAHNNIQPSAVVMWIIKT